MSLAFINPFKNELLESFIFLRKNIETSVILIIIKIPIKLTIYNYILHNKSFSFILVK